MKNNKKSRIFSRVLHHLTWANVFRVRGEKYNASVGIYNAYKEVLAAKRLIEDFGFEDVKVTFYDREYHLQFTAYRYRNGLNRYYTVSASHGFVNDYHRTNRDDMRNRTGMAEFERDCRLCRDFHDYQTFNEIAESLLYEVLTPYEFSAFCRGGEVSNIPYDITLRLWHGLRECAESVVNEAISYKKDVL